ncbi:MAG: TIGR00454 family protein [Archaeoglobaceae archaeon]
MLSLLMCGGKGRRLGKGEKPLFEVCGMRLIDHALRAFKNQSIVAVTSPFTPKTERYLLENGIEVFRASGKGFIEDYRECINSLSLKGPVIIASTDIVYLRDGIVEEIIEFYKKCGKMALKVVKDNEPAGINIILADFDEEQEEESYIVEDIVNINTIEDAERAEKLWISMRKG